LNTKKTALYDIHVSLGAKMVEFAGFLMPIQYEGILLEHKKVRTSVGVFDVSHMGEIEVRGPKALEFVNYITINDASKLAVHQAQYTAMCYPDGGIVDDLICYRMPDHYLLVVNAANTEKDFQWLIENKTLQKLTDVDLSKIKYFWFQQGKLAGVNMIISRTGYTGEPGFELYFPCEYSKAVWEAIFEAGAEFNIAPIGLGARDSLRLEKKYCLYGNDIDKTTNPVEAGLEWITKFNKGDFIGRDVLLKIKEEGPKRKLVGFLCEGKMIPRHNYPIEKEGKEVGYVTSGCFSPILEKNIGLGYVTTELSEIGTRLEMRSRGRSIPIEIVKTPFV